MASTVVYLGLKKLPALLNNNNGDIPNYAAGDDNSSNLTTTTTEIDYDAIDTSSKSQLSDSDQLLIFLVVAGIAAVVVLALLISTFVIHTLSNLKMNETQKQHRMVDLIKKRAAQRAHTDPDAKVFHFNYLPSSVRPSEDYFGKESIPVLNEQSFNKEVGILRGRSGIMKGPLVMSPSGNNTLGSGDIAASINPIMGMLGDGTSPMQVAAREARMQKAEEDAFVIGRNPLSRRREASRDGSRVSQNNNNVRIDATGDDIDT